MSGLFLLLPGFFIFLQADRLYELTPPIKGGNTTLVCETKFKYRVGIHKADIPEILTRCIPWTCLTNTIGRYAFTADNRTVNTTITNLNRIDDQTLWICRDGFQNTVLNLTVFSPPHVLEYVHPPASDIQLSETNMNMTCRTGCTYPAPTITWMYTGPGVTERNWTQGIATNEDIGSCDDSEKIYSSTLSLVKYTTFPGNEDKTVQFVCRIPSFPGLSKPLYTPNSVNIQFAVQVSSAVIVRGNIQYNSSDTLGVTSGQTSKFKCITGTSRPAPTVIWYIGKVEVQSSRFTENLTLEPTDSQHGKRIHCVAFNIQPKSQAVKSEQPTLYVSVAVTDVNIKRDGKNVNNTLEVISGESVSLTCTTGALRPNPVIIWYTGNEEKSRANTTHLTFELTPEYLDHNKRIFCKAFNVQPEIQAVTSKNLTLFIRGRPEIPYKHGLHFEGAVGGLVKIEVPFYSFPKVESYYFERADGYLIRNHSSKYMSLYYQSVNDAKLYSHGEETYSFVLALLMSDLTEEDFANYTVILENDLGSSLTSFDISLEADEQSDEHSSPQSCVIASSVTGVVLVLLFVILVVVWRVRTGLWSCKFFNRRAASNQANRENKSRNDNKLESRKDFDASLGMKFSGRGESVTITHGGDYDSLDNTAKDTSTYSILSSNQNAPTAVEERYENMHMKSTTNQNDC